MDFNSDDGEMDLFSKQFPGIMYKARLLAKLTSLIGLSPV